MLCAVYVCLAQIHHQIDLPVEGWAILGFYAVVITVEYARVSEGAQQDHRVSQRDEPGLDRALKGLSCLRVVVVHECDCVGGIALHQSIFKESAHVIFTAAVAGFEEVEVERHVEQRHAPAAAL